MAIVPNRIQDLLQFGAEHVGVWVAAGPAIGVTVAQATACRDAHAAAEAAFQARRAAAEALRVATVRQDDRLREFRRSLGDTIALVRAHAQNAPDPAAVYNTAHLPPPARPAPTPPPGQPVRLRAELSTSGSLTLRWKAANAGNLGPVVYSVARRVGTDADGPLVSVGTIGTREFTDRTIPAGSAAVTYIITPRRGRTVGRASDEFVVRFGNAAQVDGAAMIAGAGASGAAAKMAA